MRLRRDRQVLPRRHRDRRRPWGCRHRRWWPDVDRGAPRVSDTASAFAIKSPSTSTDMSWRASSGWIDGTNPRKERPRRAERARWFREGRFMVPFLVLRGLISRSARRSGQGFEYPAADASSRHHVQVTTAADAQPGVVAKDRPCWKRAGLGLINGGLRKRHCYPTIRLCSRPQARCV